ncbi:MAG TPA: HAD-IA family hydrolase [Phycisphaerae bacterium]|jgi:HAD superfamily hydrolase (TIGR01549 family)
MPAFDHSPRQKSLAARYGLVIFDMDGTLTRGQVDFAAMRQEIGLPEKGPILESIMQLPADFRRRAEDILHRHEAAAADACTLQDGALELLTALKQRNIRTALLTRNSAICTTDVLARHKLMLEHISTREDLPHKPHGEAILKITRQMRILPEQTLMVGDYLYDLQTARNAGVDSALLYVESGPLPEYATMATYVLRHLAEILPLVDG